jgi:hypothetical protein
MRPVQVVAGLSAAAVLCGICGCGGSPRDDSTRGVATAATTASATRMAIADGPIYETIEEAVEARYSSAKDTSVVIGRIVRKIANVAEPQLGGEEPLRGALFELVIDDPLGSKLAGSLPLYGFDSEGTKIDAAPPNPTPGMAGVFVVGSANPPGEAPFGEKFGRPYVILMYLARVADGSFVNPLRKGAFSLDGVRVAAKAVGQDVG